MDLTGEDGIQRVIPLNSFSAYAYKELECVTGFLGKKEAHWEAHSTKYVYIVKYFGHTISIGKGESEYEAKNDSAVVGGFKYGGYEDSIINKFFNRPVDSTTKQIIPSTFQIISFLKWKVPEDQILEFHEN